MVMRPMGVASASRWLAVLALTAWLAMACDPLDDAPLGARVKPSPTGGATAVVPTSTLPPPSPTTAPTRPPAPTAPPTATPPPSPSAPPATPTSAPPPTPGASPVASPAASPSPAAGATPAASPESQPTGDGYRRYTSSRFPYAMDYPESWQTVPSGATFESGVADLIVGERRESRANSVTVYAVPVQPDQFFLETVLADLTAAGTVLNAERDHVVAGVPAYIFSYATTANGQPYTITQAVFTRNSLGWVVTLTAIPDDDARLQHVFNRLLDSFAPQR